MFISKSASAPEPGSVWSVRLVLVCLTAVSVSLPIAWISLSKLLLFVFGLGYLIALAWRAQKNSVSSLPLTRLWTVRAVLALFFLFSFSLLWTEVDLHLALLNLVKHGKLLGIVVLVCLIRTRREARIAIAVFAIGQMVLLAGSWLLAAGVPIPWATPAAGRYVVFSSYLDQSIIFGAAAAVFWHLRSEKFWPHWLAGVLSAAALVNALLLLEGRTGYVVALVMISLAVMWAVPRRLRFATLVVTPVLVLMALYVGSAQVKERVSRVLHGSQDYAAKSDSASSEGWRLNAWRRSVQAIEEKPVLGHGVGSWTQTVKRLEGKTALQTFGEGNTSNPHQEYLLWGVELGVLGPLLLVLLILAVARDASTFTPPVGRATLSVVAAMGVACLFNSTLYDGLIGDFFCVALGLLLALGSQTSTPADTPTELGPAGVAA